MLPVLHLLLLQSLGCRSFRRGHRFLRRKERFDLVNARRIRKSLFQSPSKLRLAAAKSLTNAPKLRPFRVCRAFALVVAALHFHLV